MSPPETESPPVMAVTEGPKASDLGKRLGHKNSTRTAGDYARERYWLHGEIRRHLIAAATKSDPGKHPGNIYRTAACTWVRVDHLALVRPAGRESYHYKGLATCGSVWVCPLCASKIQERRRQEVAAAVLHMAGQDKWPMMGSFTFPHRVDQPLSLLLRLQQQAIKVMRGSREYIALMKNIGAAGRIRALEVTHGQNGWHPHTHELLFVSTSADAARLRYALACIWLKACRKVGLFLEGRDDEMAFLMHSVDVQDGDEAIGDYLSKLDDQSKWDLSHELTKSSSKSGRRAGSHPFKLAAQASTAGLFMEYVEAMKGARQLVWSRGLKAAVGLADKSDAEIAQEEVAKADDQIPVPDRAWRFVLGNDARWELTQAAASGGAPEVCRLLRLLGYEEGT